MTIETLQWLRSYQTDKLILKELDRIISSTKQKESIMQQSLVGGQNQNVQSQPSGSKVRVQTQPNTSLGHLHTERESGLK